MVRRLFMTLVAVLLGGGPGPALAQTGPGLANLAVVAPVQACADLASVDLSAAAGAATRIEAAREVAGARPYCEVTGTVARAIRFAVRLPLQGWTQRYLQTGCGGLCGTLRINVDKAEGCAPVTDGSVALASTDMGHQGMDPAWGENADQRADFAWRGVHVTSLVAKALIRAFYGVPPRYAYFSGCSDGGREALIAAQRFPDDFDGIAAGAPALNFTVQNSFHHAWLARANTGPDGKALLTAVDMPPLHAAVLRACDARDGLVDGQITDPRACRFDPAQVRCRGAYRPGQCLTARQVAAARLMYQGARSPAGERLEVGPLQPGSELEWVGVFVPREPGGAIRSADMALGTINHLLYTPNPSYSIASYPFTAAEFVRQEPARRLYSADDPDLGRFAARGGKLILWHGWADPHISPLNTIDYFAQVGATLGTAARDRFTRLFLFPGMGHCSGGDGPSQFPLLAALMAWVEGGAAPQVMIARRAGSTAMGRPAEFAPPPGGMGAVAAPQSGAAEPAPRSRPVYPYPAIAVYRGAGSLDEAASFVSRTPPQREDRQAWIGARMTPAKRP
ncbi:tannase/feruloyl esterase family alpha/beta hydrolase [Novosphingobium piscinae]|uniref:Tannase/feruloyl esterase family alpha/beta hydrolase n=1 Tax=Novosphingobium piscinae TaxID=1507448 RepID=A0A7X1G151_9SPHN|nr:tannase/feruloyl esterase family alpha/beta hydrolase [Novosphingobium piscinae]MBC2670743.1 tannase/feruloyl esterase family alpha/beta hydrolase [Novosphingobium piscinae]